MNTIGIAKMKFFSAPKVQKKKKIQVYCTVNDAQENDALWTTKFTSTTLLLHSIITAAF